MKRIVVAAGLIRGRDGSPEASLFLVSRRPAGTHLAHAWEFPGGKVEPGEAPDVALAREIEEELGVRVAVGDVFAVGHHVYPEKEVILLVYEARLVEGEPRCLEVAEIRWLTAAELVELPLPPADRPVVERLRRELAAA
ncbi:MAG: 8-oxo-dGTP diphosphatase MutT [bacterium]